MQIHHSRTCAGKLPRSGPREQIPEFEADDISIPAGNCILEFSERWSNTHGLEFGATWIDICNFQTVSSQCPVDEFDVHNMEELISWVPVFLSQIWQFWVANCCRLRPLHCLFLRSLFPSSSAKDLQIPWGSMSLLGCNFLLHLILGTIFTHSVTQYSNFYITKQLCWKPVSSNFRLKCYASS